MLVTILSFLTKPVLKYGVLVAGIATILYFGYNFMNNYFQYKNNYEQLRTVVEEQNDQISNMLEQQRLYRELENKLTEDKKQAEQKASDLEKLFSNHNLTNLSREKPTIIENKVNKGTRDVFREIETITNN